ncbi:MAG TPA: hypothetical protein VKR52_14935 [Terracidiphilus sp.]|nr:hypothetical protein [Terracidiphilus sp.]
MGLGRLIAVGALLVGVGAWSQTTAWRDGQFHVDVAGVVSRSDVVLGRPSAKADEAMPLGNGTLGVAVWSAEGFTAQLNRADTLPDRLSAGQVVISGLSQITLAKDYAGRLDLYHGEFRESGGGMTATAFVESGRDVLVVDVTGADPDKEQTALLKLWSPRIAKAAATGHIGTLAAAWVDNARPGASGRRFGSLAAITAVGRDVRVSITDPLTVTVSFRPDAKGHFRVMAAAPHYDGSGDAAQIVLSQLAPQADSVHRTHWESFWRRDGLIKVTSKDGAGEYMENLRNLYLYVAAIEEGVEYPGSQAGVADMISAARDNHRWDSSAFWHWNLRMQVAANIGAGQADLNGPYFNLYRENLGNIEAWTRENMKGLPGSCVPETMRFNGPGIEYESQWKPISIGRDCDAGFKPYYNARTISTGAEVSLWAWEQYLTTKDRDFLALNYPVMASSSRFLLAYQKEGADGLLHTSPSNAHETQWDVTDPTTDVAAIRALYPAVIEAAHILNTDAELVAKLEDALKKTPELPRVEESDAHVLVPASTDANATNVIGESWQPGAERHNVENIGLEPVWPYAIIGDTSPLFPMAVRTYEHRPFPVTADWSFDPVQAARLHLGSEVGSTLVALTEKYQHAVNGMAKWAPDDTEFYIEQSGVTADALQEALVQDYDGVIRIAPAIPPGWDFEGSVYVRGRAKVDVQTKDGVATTVVIETGDAGRVRVRSPWPQKDVDVISGRTGKVVATSTPGKLIEFEGATGTAYLVVPHGEEAARFEPVAGSAASTAKKLGSTAQIGLFAEGQ